LDVIASNVGPVNGGKTWLASVSGIFLLAATVFGVDLKAPGAGPFKVMVTPAVIKAEPKQSVTLQLKVQNISRTRQTFETLACAWYLNWTMESDYLQFPTWDCEFREPYKISLAPGASWTNHIDIVISKSIPTNHTTLRVGFSPEIVYPNHKQTTPPKYFWSNRVNVQVQK